MDMVFVRCNVCGKLHLVKLGAVSIKCNRKKE